MLDYSADAVATQDTVTQLISQIRRVARVVPGTAEQLAAVCTGDYSRRISRTSTGTTRRPRTALVSALVTDANRLVAALGQARLDEPAGQAVALLALVAG